MPKTNKKEQPECKPSTSAFSLKGAISYDKTKVNKDYANFEGYFTAPTPTGIDQIVAPISAKAEYYDL